MSCNPLAAITATVQRVRRQSELIILYEHMYVRRQRYCGVAGELFALTFELLLFGAFEVPRFESVPWCWCRLFFFSRYFEVETDQKDFFYCFACNKTFSWWLWMLFGDLDL